MGYRDYGYFKSQTVGERKAKAARTLAKLGKKEALQPVVVEGPLAVTWWGKAWNRNLQGYADYSNRIGRGRSYVRSGSVIDLRVAAGEVKALVQGSRSQPYKVSIDIAALYAPSRKRLAEACAGRLESADALLSGRFPEDLQGVLCSEASGLFPIPRQIKFSCSCPDWASMCKHVAATLYGVGVRFDQDPSLFFRLRGIRVEELVGDVVLRNADQLFTAGGRRESARLDLDNAGLGSLFGLDLAGTDSKHRAAVSHPDAVGDAPITVPKRKRGRPKLRHVKPKEAMEPLLAASLARLTEFSRVIAVLEKELRPLATTKAKAKRQ
jgi:uncharacterized Zn finger protein